MLSSISSQTIQHANDDRRKYFIAGITTHNVDSASEAIFNPGCGHKMLFVEWHSQEIAFHFQDVTTLAKLSRERQTIVKTIEMKI